MTNLTINIDCCNNIDLLLLDYYNSNITPITWRNMECEYSEGQTIIPEWYYVKVHQYRSYAYLKEEQKIFINSFIEKIKNYITILNLKNDYSQKIVCEFIEQNYRLHKIDNIWLDYIKEKFNLN